MNPDNENFEDDLGIEYYEDVVSSKKPSEKRGILEKASDVGVFGLLGLRGEARSGARVAETIAGLPGDVKELFNDIMIAIPEYFSGEELPRWRQMVEGVAPGEFSGGFGMGEPTSQQIREEITQPLSGEYLEPQNEFEKFGDEISQDFAALALPIKGKIPFTRALGSSIFSNAGGEVVGSFFGDKAQAASKMGLLFLSNMIGRKGGGVKKLINNLYKDMEASIPEGEQISSKVLSSKLDKIESVLKKGDPGDASKVEPFKKINAIREKMNGGMINVDEIPKLKNSVNEAIFSKESLKRGENKLYDIREALHDTAKEYGSENKVFLDKLKTADQAFAATETSRKVGNWIRKNIKPRDYLHAISALGVEGYALGAGALGTTLGSGAVLGSAAYTAEVLKRMAKSPALRKYYLNVIKTSLNENRAGFLRNIKKLDDGLKKSFEEELYETVEFD